MSFQPNNDAIAFTNWMLNISAQRLSGPQRIIVQAVHDAAVNNTPVSNQTWYNFNLFTAWRNPYYLVFKEYASLVVPNLLLNLISGYNLDGNSNDPVNGNNGTDSNVIYSLPAGKINQGAQFNGVNSNISIAAITPGTSWSIAFWIYILPIGSGIDDIISPGAGPTGITYQRATNRLRFYNAGFHNWATALMPGQYYCVGITSDGVDINVYLNGSLDGNFPGLAQAGNFQNIGGAVNNNTFNGYMDIVNFWSRALSSQEMSDFYNGGSGIQYPF